MNGLGDTSRGLYYRVTRTDDGVEAYSMAGCRTADLNPRLDLFNHSPTGFEFGYGGSGPAQLALALLADALKDDERAVRLHQRFKFEFVAQTYSQSWEITQRAIVDWADKADKQTASP